MALIKDRFISGIYEPQIDWSTQHFPPSGQLTWGQRRDYKHLVDIIWGGPPAMLKTVCNGGKYFAVAAAT